MKSGVDCKGREWEENFNKLSTDKDLTGKMFGRLTVLFRVQNDKRGLSQWLTMCECGNKIVTRGSSLRNGHTTSCGCAKREIVSEKLTKLINPGEQFGYWTVMYKSDGYLGKGAHYHCKCKCGTERDIIAEHLKNGASLSCGCLQREKISQNIIDLTGLRFGHWTVLKFADNQHGTELLWTCVCDCGTIKDVSGHSLKRGSSTSCGCIKSSIGELNIIHILDNSGIEYMHNQGYFKDLIGIGGSLLRYDFILLNDNQEPFRLIEFDGPQHNEPNDWFGKISFETTQIHDAIKNQYALSHNIPLVRLPYSKRDSMTLDDILGDKYLYKGEI